MNHRRIFWSQVAHLLHGFAILVLIAAFAAVLDLASSWLQTKGVSPFTVDALLYASHGVLIMDLVLFAIFVLIAAIDMIRTMLKPKGLYDDRYL